MSTVVFGRIAGKTLSDAERVIEEMLDEIRKNLLGRDQKSGSE